MSAERLSHRLPVYRFALRLSVAIRRWLPNPFLFALILTYLVFLSGVAVEDQLPVEMLQFWYNGFWGLLQFGMQMVLIIATGYVLAYHPRVQRGLSWLATVPANGGQAAVLIGFVAMVTALIHWGLSLILGAVFARELGKRLHEQGIPVYMNYLGITSSVKALSVGSSRRLRRSFIPRRWY